MAPAYKIGDKVNVKITIMIWKSKFGLEAGGTYSATIVHSSDSHPQITFDADPKKNTWYIASGQFEIVEEVTDVSCI